MAKPSRIEDALAPFDERKSELTIRERLNFAICKWTNVTPKGMAIKRWWQAAFGRGFVDRSTFKLLHVEGLDNLSKEKLPPGKGVLMCANHRSFFDQYILSSLLFRNKYDHISNLTYPVRANFFYDRLAGVVVNLAMSGGAMFPPIFRDRERKQLNQSAVDYIVESLQSPQNLIGMHPEGRRGTGDDPYTLLRAQPGVGRVAIRSACTVIPVWINGPSNSITKQYKANAKSNPSPDERIVVLFGEPVDMSEFMSEESRPSTDLKAARHILNKVKQLSERDKVLRAHWRANVPSVDG